MRVRAIVEWLYGKISRVEIEKFSFISFALMCATAAYWIVHSVSQALQESIIASTQAHSTTIWYYSLGLSILLILICSVLADRITQYRLITIISFCYVFSFVIIAHFLRYALHAFADPVSQLMYTISTLSFLLVESFGVVMIALLWAFYTCTLPAASARKGLFLMVVGTQLGVLVGSRLSLASETLGIPVLVAIAATIILFIPLTLAFEARLLCKRKPECKAFEHDEYKPEERGVFTGIKLWFTNRYLIAISFLFAGSHILGRVIGLFDDHMLSDFSESMNLSMMKYAKMLAQIGQLRSLIMVILAIFVISLIFRRIQMQNCLSIFPVFTAIILVFYLFFGFWNVLWPFFIASNMILYLIYRPAIELLYTYVSFGARLKARLWIRLFDWFIIGLLTQNLIRYEYFFSVYLGVFAIIVALSILAVGRGAGILFERPKKSRSA
jgi:hypothetical protein